MFFLFDQRNLITLNYHNKVTSLKHTVLGNHIRNSINKKGSKQSDCVETL